MFCLQCLGLVLDFIGSDLAIVLYRCSKPSLGWYYYYYYYYFY